MKQRLLKLTLLLTLGLSLAACHHDNPGDDTRRERQSIVILFENDVHCATDGYALMAGLRDAIADTAWVGIVSSGDFLQGGTVGAISTGAYIRDIMRTMDYDAVTLGNHEFDYGMPCLLELMDGFNAPIICANLYDMQGERLFPAYTIRSYGGHNVAYVGVLTATTASTESYSFYADGQQLYDLRPDQMTQLVQQAVDEARAAGAEYVVLLSHLGEYPLSPGVNSHQMVAATTGIDIVFDGHSHTVVPGDTVLNAAGQPVCITQTGTQFANVGKLVIGPDGKFSLSLIPTSDIPYRNTTVARVADSLTALVNDHTSRVLFHSDYRLMLYENGMRLIRTAETNAGDLVADAMRHAMGADLGFNNGGGFRSEIEPGDVTYRQVIDLLPFDNRIVKIEATGAQVVEMLRLCTQALPYESGDFPQVSGLRFTVHVVEDGNNTVSDVEVEQPDGSYIPIDPAATYTIGTSDYCAYRGGFNDVFLNCTVLEISSILYYDVLAPYVNDVLGGSLPERYAQPQGRITIQ